MFWPDVLKRIQRNEISVKQGLISLENLCLGNPPAPPGKRCPSLVKICREVRSEFPHGDLEMWRQEVLRKTDDFSSDAIDSALVHVLD